MACRKGEPAVGLPGCEFSSRRWPRSCRGSGFLPSKPEGCERYWNWLLPTSLTRRCSASTARHRLGGDKRATNSSRKARTNSRGQAGSKRPHGKCFKASRETSLDLAVERLWANSKRSDRKAESSGKCCCETEGDIFPWPPAGVEAFEEGIDRWIECPLGKFGFTTDDEAAVSGKPHEKQPGYFCLFGI